MRIERALAVRNSAAAAYRDLFSTAQHFGLSHANMLDRRATIWECMPKKTPRWVYSYLNGVWDQLQADAYRHALVYGGKVDGAFYSTHRDRPDYYEKNGIAPRDYADDGRVKERGHYWAHNLKPFYVAA